MSRDVEQEIIQALRNLPIAIVVTRKTNEEHTWYIWQCLEGSGTAIDLARAMNNALHFLIGRIGHSHQGDIQGSGLKAVRNQAGPD